MEAYIAIPLIMTIAVVASYTLTKTTIKLLERKGLTGIDVHKPWRPRVAEPGGIALIASYAILIPLVLLLNIAGVDEYKFLVASASILYAGLIGLVDDFKVLDAKTKTLLAFTVSAPIILFNTYTPRPLMPFAGMLRITIIYPLLLPFAYMIVLNAVNMSDTHNGVMPSTALLVLSVVLFSTASAYYKGLTDATGLLIALIAVAILLGYIWFNWYPAKVFNGDSGSFIVGALIITSAILGRAEVPAIVAMLVYIVNGFQILSSIKGLVERRNIVRPVIVRNGLITANKDPRAPITIPHLLSLKEPVTEVEVIAGYIILSIISCMLGLITAVICYWT